MITSPLQQGTSESQSIYNRPNLGNTVIDNNSPVRQTVLQTIRERLFVITQITDKQHEQLFVKVNSLYPIGKPDEKEQAKLRTDLC